MNSLERRFVIRKCVGSSLGASSGFPEGDPLSPCAMCIAVLVYHRYMEIYEPRLTAHSYVDNWAHTATNAAVVARGICLSQCVCDMLSLELDMDKSYVWGLSSSTRKELQLTGLPVVTHARELGGFLTYQGRTHNRELVKRCCSLGPLFQKLRRSLAPLPFKLQSLAAKFWARALHGASACPLAEAHLTALRSKAIQALQVNTAGLNPLIRLSVSGHPDADPGFYQLWRCVSDARRMMRKHADLVVHWRQFMRQFDGRLHHGPFSKLLVVLSQVGWHITNPPAAIDHQGLCHNMLAIPRALLRERLEHAWLQHVSSRVQHRHHMCDLYGLEPDLLQLDTARMSALDLARLRALQSGAFLFGSEHAVHDREQSGLCVECDLPDTRQHRICVCPKYAAYRPNGVNLPEAWEATASCVRNHLLPPANPHLGGFLSYLHHLPDCTGHLSGSPSTNGRHYLFTDGSCLQWGFASLAIEAWAVVCASTGEVIGSAPVHGMLQTAPWAEILAILCAFKRTVRFGLQVTIWSDALHVVEQLHFLLAGGILEDDCANHDMWLQIQLVLEQVPSDAVSVQHVHSHLDAARLTSPLEDWIKQWNDAADRTATIANVNRSVSCKEAHARALDWFQHNAQLLRFWRQLYFDIAGATLGQRPSHNHADVGDLEFPDGQILWIERVDTTAERVPVNWCEIACTECPHLPADFVKDLVQAFLDLDSVSLQACTVSWFELVFLLHETSDLAFPAICPVSGCWRSARDVPYRPYRTHVAVQLRMIRKVFTLAFRAAGLEDVLCDDVDVTACGISMPIGGLILGCPEASLNAARQKLAIFARARKIRVMADLARPI